MAAPSKYRTILLFGMPGSGKGTQGAVLGQLPDFIHVSMGDVFRKIPKYSKFGQEIERYTGKGLLVPDDLTVELWRHSIEAQVVTAKFKPDIDALVLDGIPRNPNQARLMGEMIDVRQVFHLSCPNRDELVRRLRKRALKDNRLDDANEAVIRQRLETYERETRPVLDYYQGIVTRIDLIQYWNHLPRG